MKKWVGNKYLAKCCNDTLQSKYPGHFVSCKCGKVAIDQTPYYCRYIGDLEKIEIILDKVGETVVHFAPAEVEN
jgi:hypothetical protein